MLFFFLFSCSIKHFSKISSSRFSNRETCFATSNVLPFFDTRRVYFCAQCFAVFKKILFYSRGSELSRIINAHEVHSSPWNSKVHIHITRLHTGEKKTVTRATTHRRIDRQYTNLTQLYIHTRTPLHRLLLLL